MTSTPVVVVHRDATVLASAVAARIVTRLVDAQAERGAASLVLTGGTIGIASLRALHACDARHAVDWSRLDLWWGDERFLAAGDPERNDVQATGALLKGLGLDPARVHAVGSRGGLDGNDADAAAARYATELAAAAPHVEQVPAFDVLLLGMGAEGHTASIFPESPAAHDGRTAFAVHGCPKPPATRVSMGFTALCSAREVWMVVSGADKAPAVALALSGAGRVQVPAAGALGRQETLWLLDEDAASALPRDLRRR